MMFLLAYMMFGVIGVLIVLSVGVSLVQTVEEAATPAPKLKRYRFTVMFLSKDGTRETDDYTARSETEEGLHLWAKQQLTGDKVYYSIESIKEIEDETTTINTTSDQIA